MSAKKKTVFKGFDYMHCDDFAKYLNEMAAKGWHFKEWGLGLVFAKGEPEFATYTVEVFTKASENDTRPEPHTQEFAEYCEAAGWKLIDAKQKFCIFKKVQEEAVEILTPEERVENAYKGTISGTAITFLVLYGINAVLQWFTLFDPVIFSSNIFSSTDLFNFLVWNLLFLLQICKLIDGLVRKYKLKKQLKTGNGVYIGDRQNHKVNFNWTTLFTIVLVVLLTSYLIVIDRMELVVLNVIIIVATLILAAFIAKVRPESNTNFVVQIVFSMLLSVFIIISAVAMVSKDDDIELSQSDLPLQTTDYRESMGEVEDISIYHERNIFGSSDIYFVFCEDDTLIYYIYRSEYGWIMDKIWDEELDKKSNESVVDCTSEWEADIAFRNIGGEYLVRYEDTIFILNDYEGLYLTQDQINIIRDKLDLR